MLCFIFIVIHKLNGGIFNIKKNFNKYKKLCAKYDNMFFYVGGLEIHIQLLRNYTILIQE